MQAPNTPPRQTARSSSTTPPPAPRWNQFRDAIAEEQQQQVTFGGNPHPPTMSGTPFLDRLMAIAAESNQNRVPPAVPASATATTTTTTTTTTMAARPAVSHGPTSYSAPLGEDPFTDPATDAPSLAGNKRPREEGGDEEDDREGAAGIAGGASKKMKA